MTEHEISDTNCIRHWEHSPINKTDLAQCVLFVLPTLCANEWMQPKLAQPFIEYRNTQNHILHISLPGLKFRMFSDWRTIEFYLPALNSYQAPAISLHQLNSGNPMEWDTGSGKYVSGVERSGGQHKHDYWIQSIPSSVVRHNLASGRQLWRAPSTVACHRHLHTKHSPLCLLLVWSLSRRHTFFQIVEVENGASEADLDG